MDDTRYQITREALAELERELNELETEGRRKMADRIRTAREWGDLKENSEYHDAKDAQAHLETKIQMLQDRQRNAVIVEAISGGGTVGLGSVVKVADAATGRESTYTLVTAAEADPASGRLGIDSPLARALAGAKLGDEVEFNAPKGVRRLRIAELG